MMNSSHISNLRLVSVKVGAIGSQFTNEPQRKLGRLYNFCVFTSFLERIKVFKKYEMFIKIVTNLKCNSNEFFKTCRNLGRCFLTQLLEAVEKDELT